MSYIHKNERFYAPCTQRLRKSSKGYQTLTISTISVILRYDQDWSLRPCALWWIFSGDWWYKSRARSPDSWEGSTKETQIQRQFRDAVQSPIGSVVVFTAKQSGRWCIVGREQDIHPDRMSVPLSTEDEPIFWRAAISADAGQDLSSEHRRSCFHVLFAHDTWFLNFKRFYVKILLSRRGGAKQQRGGLSVKRNCPRSSWLIVKGSCGRLNGRIHSNCGQSEDAPVWWPEIWCSLIDEGRGEGPRPMTRKSCCDTGGKWCPAGIALSQWIRSGNRTVSDACVFTFRFVICRSVPQS